ncbi:hypothetical protein CF319_g3505 [Tilletia indica]|nr:hypothetical protein CF319_g3505 [Tilletia indica]
MDFVLFEDPQAKAAYARNVAASAMNGGIPPGTAAMMAANGMSGQPFPGSFNNAGGMDASNLSAMGAASMNNKFQLPLAFSNVPMGATSGMAGPSSAAAMNSQPLALGGFGGYRQPPNPLTTPTPQQLASLVASQHAAQAAGAGSQNRPGAQAGGVLPFASMVGSGGMSSSSNIGTALAQEAQRMGGEQTSPFMGANTPLPFSTGTDVMPLFPSSSSSTHTPTSSNIKRQSSLGSNCSSSGAANELNGMDVFNGSPVNPPSGSFGPPIQNLSLGGGSGLRSSGKSMRSGSADSFVDGPLFPQPSISSAATTPSAVSMQATGSNTTNYSLDGARSCTDTASTMTPTSDPMPFATATTSNTAANSLFSIAQQQQQAQNQASAGTGWQTRTSKPLSKTDESDPLSTPKAREQRMPPMSTSWSSLFANKQADDQAWYNMEDALNTAGSGSNSATMNFSMDTSGTPSGVQGIGASSTAQPFGSGGGFFSTPALAEPLDVADLDRAQALLRPNAGAQTDENGRRMLRGPSAANAAAGNSASSGLSLFEVSETSTLDEDEDDADTPASGIDEGSKPTYTALQAIGKNVGLSGFNCSLGTDGNAMKGSTNTQRAPAGRQQPTQLSMLAKSTLFNAGEALDVPRFAAVDENGTSDSDDEAELDETIRRRRREQYLMRQQGQAQNAANDGSSLSSSTSSLNMPGSSDAGTMVNGSGSRPTGSSSANNYLGTHPGMSRRSSSSTSGEDSLMSPPIRDSAEAVAHFGPLAPASQPIQRATAGNFRSQISRGGGGGGKGKTGPPGHHPTRPTLHPSHAIAEKATKASKAEAAKVQEAVEDDEDEDDEDESDDEEEEEGEDEDEEGDDDDDYADAFGHASGKPRGGGSGAGRGRNTRTSRSAGAVSALSGSGAAPAQKRRKRQSPKADEPVNISTLGGSHTTSTGLTVCDYVSPLVMMSEGGPTAASVKEARCGTVFHRPYDLSRHRETIHAREEAKLVKAGQLKIEDCVVMGKEIPAEKVMAGATEWKCEGKNGCGSVFSRKDALLRHQRIRGHGR